MINTDSPIKTKKEDLLGRYNFSASLSKAILKWEKEEGVVIGLYGKWGSGKSSVINLTLECIDKAVDKSGKKDNPIIIRFNPWNFTEQNQLITIFFNELAKSISYYDTGKDAIEVGKKLITYSKFFTVLSLIPGLDPYSKVVKKVFEEVGETTKSWGELQTKNLETYREELDSSIKKLGRKIIIIIDDIDRLNEKEVRQIFQLVKQNANFPNTVYLLALDITQIKQEKEFIEKIIQVGFHIPAIDDSKLRNILFAELDKILKPFPEKLWRPDRWGDVFNDGYKYLFDSLRKVKRYISSLQFNINIISSEINPLDFFVVEAIRVFFPEFYEEFAKSKDFFVGRYFMDNERERETRKQQFETMIELVKDDKSKRIVKSLMFNLFPQIEGVYRNQNVRHEDEWFKEKRICSEERFGNYFYLSLSESEISQKEIDILVGASDNLDKITELLDRFIKDGRIRRCLDRLPEFIESIPMKNIYSFVLPFFNIGDKISREVKSDIDFGVDIQLVRLAYHLIKRLPEVDRTNVVKKLILDSKNVNAPAHLISIEKDPARKDDPDERLMNNADLEEMTKLTLEKIKSFAKSGKLHESPGLAYLLYRWKDWGKLSDPKNYVKRLISTPKGMASLINGFTYQTISSRSGKEHHINYKELKVFVDLGDLKNKILLLNKKDKKILTTQENSKLEDYLKGVDIAIAGKEDFF